MLALVLSAVTVLSDYFVKMASLQQSLWNRWIVVGILISCPTAFGWAYIMRNMKLSTLGIIYGVSCIVMLAIMSVVVFHEKINAMEIFGIFLGIVSIIIMYKFA